MILLTFGSYLREVPQNMNEFQRNDDVQIDSGRLEPTTSTVLTIRATNRCNVGDKKLAVIYRIDYMGERHETN